MLFECHLPFCHQNDKKLLLGRGRQQHRDVHVVMSSQRQLWLKKSWTQRMSRQKSHKSSFNLCSCRTMFLIKRRFYSFSVARIFCVFTGRHSSDTKDAFVLLLLCCSFHSRIQRFCEARQKGFITWRYHANFMSRECFWNLNLHFLTVFIFKQREEKFWTWNTSEWTRPQTKKYLMLRQISS